MGLTRESFERWVRRLVCVYAGGVLVLWLAIDVLADRVWFATLAAFGPRWWAAIPLAPFALVLPILSRRVAQPVFYILTFTGCALLLGTLDLRLGLASDSGPRVVRVLTHNLGGSRVSAEALDRLLRAQEVDVAALQECPFYDNAPARLGWHFFYGGDLCVASRFPFTVLDDADPGSKWRRGDRVPLRLAMDGPALSFQLLNVHFETIRNGLEPLGLDVRERLSRLDANRRISMQDSRSAGDRLKDTVGPVLVVGDFNLPVESAIYRANWGAFRNLFSDCGLGFGYTKHTKLFSVRIDHVLASEHWTCVAARVVSSPYGGDHDPLVVDVGIRATVSANNR
jgi:endonuclease/exonuclease/phosphatase (EEP) superfamily protein YafD